MTVRVSAEVTVAVATEVAVMVEVEVVVTVVVERMGAQEESESSVTGEGRTMTVTTVVARRAFLRVEGQMVVVEVLDLLAM